MVSSSVQLEDKRQILVAMSLLNVSFIVLLFTAQMGIMNLIVQNDSLLIREINRGKDRSLGWLNNIELASSNYFFFNFL